MSKPSQPLRHALLLACFWLALAPDAWAVSLGKLRGVALIGRPLNVTVPVQADGPARAEDLCVQVDVFFGDNQVFRGNVLLNVETSGSQAQARVQTLLPLDEPTVTLYASAGCQQKVSRRYVMLAEPAGEVVQGAQPATPNLPTTRLEPAVIIRRVPPGSASPAPGPAAAPPDAVLPAPGSLAEASRQLGAGAGARNPDPLASRLSRDLAAPPRAAASAVRAASIPRPAAPAARPRLRVDLLDAAAGSAPQLRLTPQLLLLPTDDSQRRAGAAATWRSLNMTPEQLQQDAERLLALERDAKGLREQSVKSQAAIHALQTQAAQARGERYANELVYALAGLLALGLLGALWFWYRARRDDSDWTAGDSIARITALGEDDALPPAGVARGMAGPDSQGPSDFSHSLPAMARTVSAEELLDVQQQADFFVSLGQPEQAVAVLREHINDNAETSALAYLDLLQLYHRFQRRDDYEALRADFIRAFNAHVPGFGGFSDNSEGLEAYPEVLDRICALWPSASVLDLIEDWIFLNRGVVEGVEPFSLSAYRDLLLLYTIAKDLGAAQPTQP